MVQWWRPTVLPLPKLPVTLISWTWSCLFSTLINPRTGIMYAPPSSAHRMKKLFIIIYGDGINFTGQRSLPTRPLCVQSNVMLLITAARVHTLVVLYARTHVVCTYIYIQGGGHQHINGSSSVYSIVHDGQQLKPYIYIRYSYI